jgi:hypothetical protein
MKKMNQMKKKAWTLLRREKKGKGKRKGSRKENLKRNAKK